MVNWSTSGRTGQMLLCLFRLNLMVSSWLWVKQYVMENMTVAFQFVCDESMASCWNFMQFDLNVLKLSFTDPLFLNVIFFWLVGNSSSSSVLSGVFIHWWLILCMVSLMGCWWLFLVTASLIGGERQQDIVEGYGSGSCHGASLGQLHCMLQTSLGATA